MLWIELHTLQLVIFLLRSSKAQISQESSYQDSTQREHYLDTENLKIKKYHDTHNGFSNYRRYIFNSDERRKCKCSCNTCEKPKRCCKKVCTRCRIQHQPPRYQQVPSSLVMIPYPVPFFVYPTQNTTESNQTTTTTDKADTNFSRIPLKFTMSSTPPLTSSTYYLDTKYYKKRNAKYAAYSKCPRIAQCFRNSIESEKYNYRNKSLDKKRKLEIMHNIRPTIDIRDTRSKDTIQKLPKYGLVSIQDFV